MTSIADTSTNIVIDWSSTTIIWDATKEDCILNRLQLGNDVSHNEVPDNLQQGTQFNFSTLISLKKLTIQDVINYIRNIGVTYNIDLALCGVVCLLTTIDCFEAQKISDNLAKDYREAFKKENRQHTLDVQYLRQINENHDEIDTLIAWLEKIDAGKLDGKEKFIFHTSFYPLAITL